MSNYTLTYRKGRSQEIYIEEISNSKDQNELLYFKQEYDDAIRLIKEIIILQGTGANDEKKDENENGKKNKRDIKIYGCNNRILFAGQRGCGKTSVMQSLAEYLSKNKITIKKNDVEEDNDKIKCYCLPMVDPSHFDNNNNILLTVITSMFSAAKKKMETNDDKDESAEREDLLKQFEKVFKSLDSIKSELSSYTLESLNRKSDAEDLRDKMNILVRKFLKYVVGNKEARLVLLIDDIDMSVSYAPEMLEQLRKYLELDNMIILMSANLGQLNNEMREKYSSAFQYTLKDSNQALSIDVEDLATKYLLKLFPTSRRINVERHVDQLLKTDLIVEGWNDEGWNNKEDDEKNFQKVILSLIWSRTRLLFISKDPQNTLHPIIPTNLRDLAQFLDMLTSLEKIEPRENNLFKDLKEYNECQKNLQVFKNYVMKTWIPNHLKVDEELVFHNIPTDITEINKHLINSINKIGTLHKKDLMSREVGLDIIERNAGNVFIDRDIYTMVSPNDPKFVKANKISDIFNQPSNYSYGDLLLMIDKYETYFESEEHRKFTDAIKIYYSILLFDTMFFKSNAVVFNLYERIAENIEEKENELKQVIINHTKEETNDDGTEKEIIEDDDLKEIANIGEKLNNDRAEESNKVALRQERTSHLANFVKKALQSEDIYYEKDKELFKRYTNFSSQIIPIQQLIGGNVYYPNYFEIITDKNFNQKGPSFDAKRAFYHKIEVDPDGSNVENKCPFFAVLYYGDIRPDRYEKDHIYDTKFQTNSEVGEKHYVTFDILSILNNMLNPWQTISRLDASETKKTMQLKWFEEIQKWGEINKIEGTHTHTHTHTPNAILPFYSVDIMLQYLSQSYSASMVTGNESDYSEEKTLITNGCKSLYGFSGDNPCSIILENLCHLGLYYCEKQLTDSKLKFEKKQEIIKSISDNKWDNSSSWSITINGENYREYVEDREGAFSIEKLDELSGMKISDYNEIVTLIIDIHNLIEGERSNLTVDKIRTLLEGKKSNENDVSKKARIQQLLVNLSILGSLYEKYKNLQNSEKNIEFFRDYAISLLLEQYTGSKKDRDGLIKELRKYTTISEIYKHLVEVLWENAIMELLIRADIQEKVRMPQSVGTYYKLLWEETKKMLKYITIDQIHPKGIYENLCKKAGIIFICDNFLESEK